VTIFIDNKSARRLFLHRHGLAHNPASRCNKTDIQNLIESIGFVQVDSIKTVERAHHLILFSRRQTYKHAMLADLLEKQASLFENWTHDASIIPSKLYPYWKHKFKNDSIAIAKRWEKWGRKGFVEISDQITEHIDNQGPTFSRDLKPEEKKSGKPGWWDWHPQKTCLEYLWRTGKTAVSHRRNFQKAYDLSERVIPTQYFEGEVSDEQFLNWACSSAHQHLGFATHGEIAAFWNLVPPATAKSWVESPDSGLVPAEIQSFDKESNKQVWVRPDIAETICQLSKLPGRIRILSPFDPLLRDRKRAEFLFGFNYRIEVFVPEAKRQYGYYVFPILQGDRLVGRIDMKADRKNSVLNIRRIWLEQSVRWSDARKSALNSELKRIARFSGLNDHKFSPDAFENSKNTQNSQKPIKSV
jgi:uncharacterized protein YcaQ